VELPDRDPTVPAVAVEPGVFRMLLDPLGEGLDRLAVAAEVGQATPEPDDRVRIAWRGRVGGARLFQVPLEPRPRRRIQLHGVQRLAEERGGFRKIGRASWRER